MKHVRLKHKKIKTKKEKERKRIMAEKCSEKTEVYSRVCGYFRPVSNWNKGKREEFKDRKEYCAEKKA